MNFFDRLYFTISCNLQNFFKDEEGAVDIVAIVVLIGIAVLLAVIFRTRIEALLEQMFGTIESGVTDAMQ